MTLIYELDLDSPKTYPRTKKNFLDQGFRGLEQKRDRQTDRQLRPNALLQRIRWYVVGMYV